MIIIIGGGISGLAAAHELTRRGVPFRLLEASSRPGGLIRTEHAGGFTIDGGADSMLSSKPSARGLCADAGLTGKLQDMIEPRTAYVLARERLFPLPAPSVLGLPLTIAAAARFELLPVHARVRVLLERFVSAGSHADESIASFFRRRFGAATVDLVAQPLLGGIHAGDVARLSVRSLFPALLHAEAAGGVLHGLRAGARARGGVFNSLSGGMETLPQAVARTLPAGTIRYDAPVHAVTRAAGGWRVDAARGSEAAAAVLFATPVHVTGRLLEAVDPHAAAICAEIPHASTVSVSLAWRRDAVAHPLRGSGFVVARDGGSPFRITAATWVSSKWEGRAPAGYALLRAFIGGMHDAGAIDLTDEDLIAIATRDLGRVLGIRTPPELARVYRWRDASPQLNVGHDDRVQRIARQLTRHPGVFVTGRGFRAVGIPDCISDARNASAAAAEYLSRSQRDARIDEEVRR